VFDFAARKVAEIDAGEPIADWAAGESATGIACIAVAREAGVRLLRVPELAVIADLATDRKKMTVLFGRKAKEFIIAGRDGEILAINID
jgi:hypothetical protein